MAAAIYPTFINNLTEVSYGHKPTSEVFRLLTNVHQNVFNSEIQLYSFYSTDMFHWPRTEHITDASNGDPVPFASVHLEGTMIGASSDHEGHYSISVPHDGLLVFSSVGYKTKEVNVSSSGIINVELSPDSEFIDETIVVAYGTATKSSFTGSASVVNSQAIESRVATDVTSALAGTAPGVQIIRSTRLIE